MDDIFLQLAERNGGYLHRSDVLEWGGSDRLIRRAVTEQVLRRIRVGTYVFRDAFDDLSPEDQHVVLARSVVDKFPEGSVALSHHSAAATHGLAVFGADLSVVHLTRLDHGSGRVESGIVHHGTGRAVGDVVVLDGRLVVPVSTAVWQTACHTAVRGSLVVMDSALHQGLLLPEQLAESAGPFERWPGSRSARVMARMADAGAETPGESLMRYVCLQGSLPRPDTQYVVRAEDGSFVARSDLGWEEYRHVGEFDGMRKYWRDRRHGEDASDVVVREKVREDRIRALEHGMSRATWTEVLPDASRRLAERLRHDLEQSHRLHAKGRRFFA